MNIKPLVIPVLVTLALTGCGGSSPNDISSGMGPNPLLPQPQISAIPVAHVAKAIGWSDTATPVAADGTAVNAFAKGLRHPRWLYQLPNGDILVAETNFPCRGWRAASKAGLPSIC